MAVTAGRAVILEASGVLGAEELLQLLAPVDLSGGFGVSLYLLLVLADDVTETRCAIPITPKENLQDELGLIFTEGCLLGGVFNTTTKGLRRIGQVGERVVLALAIASRRIGIRIVAFTRRGRG